MLQNAPAHVKERCELLIYNFTVPLTVKNLLDLSKPDVAEISAWLDEQIINAEENFHCDIENALMPALDEMLAGKTAFYSDKESSQEFLHAICVQYMRTKKMRDRFAQITTAPVPGADMKRCGNLFTLAAAMRVADSLYQDREKFKIVLLDNDTASPFITGDQPVINIHATYGSGAPPERLEYIIRCHQRKRWCCLSFTRKDRRS